MGYTFETKDLKKRVVSCVVCGMIALFLGTGSLVFMFVARQYLIGGILVVVFVAPIIIWRIIYARADRDIYKRIEGSPASITAFCIVESCAFFKNDKRDKKGRTIYLTSVLTGGSCGDIIPYRLFKSAEQFKRGEFVLIKFIKEQYQDCLIVRKAKFSEYKNQFPPDDWDGYEGDGSDLLD